MKYQTLFIILFALLINCSSESTDNTNSPEELTVTDIDNNLYETVQIGNQTWMKQNLNVSKYRNGEPILKVTDGNEWKQLDLGAWCYYDNENEKGLYFGKLYNWQAVNDPRGIAPEGWHIPTMEEMSYLKDYLIENGYNYDGSNAGNKIAKSLASNLDDSVQGVVFDWETSDPNATPPPGAVVNNQDSNNSSGFTGLPAGSRFYIEFFNSIFFNGIENSARWWTSTESSNISAESYVIYGENESFINESHSKVSGFSVRCIKDY